MATLRPFNPLSDSLYVPLLLRNSLSSYSSTSNSRFLLSPRVLSLYLVLISVTLYNILHLFTHTLILPGEEHFEKGWQDYVALGIYAVPSLAIIGAGLFGIAAWYHGRVWKRIVGRETNREDVLDVYEYYTRKEGNSFWCLEFENEITACFALDAANPGVSLPVLESEDLPVAPASNLIDKSNSSGAAEDDENAADLELFRMANSIKPTSTPELTNLRRRNIIRPPSFSSSADEPTKPSSASSEKPLVPPSLLSESGTVQLRHLSISPRFLENSSYRAGRQIQSHILNLAMRTAFGPRPSSSSLSESPLKQSNTQRLILLVDPVLQPDLRAIALDRGFKIRGMTPSLDGDRSALPGWLAKKEGIKKQGRMGPIAERLLRSIWPLSFEREVMVLDREVYMRA